MSEAAVPTEAGGVNPDSEPIRASRPELQLVSSEDVALSKQLTIARNLRLQEVTVALPNRTGYRLHEVNGRRMTVTVAKLFAESGGELEIIGSPEPESTDTLALKFPYDPIDISNSYRAVFDDMLDGFNDRHEYDLRLFPLARDNTHDAPRSQEIFQLYTHELHEQMRLILSGCVRYAEFEAIIERDVEAKWHLADHLIELRDNFGWRPEA